jgi:hypothetical protein
MGHKVIDTHVHVWPLDDAPGHRPALHAKVRAPKEAAPVEWLLEDMAEYGVAHCVLGQSRRWLQDNFAAEEEWREIPDEIVLARGVAITVPRPRVPNPLVIWPVGRTDLLDPNAIAAPHHNWDCRPTDSVERVSRVNDE